jgi:tetratricopeptide (TPR) repeat protein
MGPFTTRFVRTAGVAVALLVSARGPVGGQAPADSAPPSPPPPQQLQLQPTIHAAVPENIDDFWFAPRPGAAGAARNAILADAAIAYGAGNYAGALTAARQAVATGGPLEPYAQLYIGLSELRQSRAAEAVKALDAVLARKPEGYLAVAATIGKAEAAELRGDYAAAADLYDKLSTQKSAAPEDVLTRLAKASLAAGDRKRAAEAFQRVYYEFPLSDAASSARDALGSLQDFFAANTQRELGRALILFGAKRYSEARSAFQDLQRQVTGDDREVVDLRIAESDYFLKRYAAGARRRGAVSRAGVAQGRGAVLLSQRAARPGPAGSGRHAHARHVDGLSGQQLGGGRAEQPRHAVHRHQPGRPRGPDVQGAVRPVSGGPHAERSAWKYGWWAYTTGQLRRDRRGCSKGRGDLPALRLPPAVPLLGPRARGRRWGIARPHTPACGSSTPTT